MSRKDFQALWQFRHQRRVPSEHIVIELFAKNPDIETAFRLISYYCRKAPPIGVGTFSSREAVLPLVCCVKEDGLQMDRPVVRPTVYLMLNLYVAGSAHALPGRWPYHGGLAGDVAPIRSTTELVSVVHGPIKGALVPLAIRIGKE
jgi:hypothetical protein